MSEHLYRLLIGIWLVASLAAQWPWALYALIGLLLVEGLINRRLHRLFGQDTHFDPQDPDSCEVVDVIPFEAERALRLIVASLLVIGLLSEPLWWLPWMLSFALIGAGLSGICPMVMALRWLGMR